ncbi:TetR/AcrR family transcriptional regulator [Pseudolabrys taiwanensis]|nr:TetR/AcrR family transcriptional regulator [Pseudolabrys taiwanensis]
MTDQSVSGGGMAERRKAAKTAPRKREQRVEIVGDSARDTRSAARREAILAAALDEFSASGFEATRLDDVAKRAGIAKGTIYLYFRDKETLFQELIREMLTPLVGSIEAMGAADLPLPDIASHIADLFMREVYETRRKDVVRLMISEGRRFPKLAEFYYREVLSRIIAAVRALLNRAAARGEVAPGLVEFPQLIAAPGLMAIIWNGLFERYDPLDVRTMMQTHVELLFGARREP